jgi:ribosomal-protein-alanine N-acetyltransferase
MAIRWKIRRDLSQIMAIERESFDDPWNEEHFRDITDITKNKTIMTMVCEEEVDRIRGFIVYGLRAKSYHLLNLAVTSSARRQGIATQFIARIQDNCSSKRHTITTVVREANLTGQLFFRSCGFRANRITRKYFRNGEDAYHMEWDAHGYTPTNRIAQHYSRQ